MAFNTVDGLGVHTAFRVREQGKGAIVHVAARAACNLRHFGGGEVAVGAAIKFAGGGEGHMVNVHVEAHADGIGRHQIIYLARLIQFHLRVTCARRQSPHHNGSPALLAAHNLGQGVNIIGGKRHQGRAAWQAGQFLWWHE